MIAPRSFQRCAQREPRTVVMLDEVEGITGDERQGGGRRRVQHPQFIRLDDQLPRGPVSKGSARRDKTDFVAGVQASNRAEERVTVRRQRCVSVLPGKRGIWQVADGNVQRVLIVAFHYDSGEADAWNLEAPDGERRLMA